MIEIPDHIKEIIERKFLNRESESDLAALRQWRNEHCENEEEYNQLMLLWSDTGSVLDAADYDSGSAWNKLQKRLSPVSVSPGNSKVISVRQPAYSFRRLLIAAVTIGIVIFAGWWGWHEKFRAPVMQLVEATTDTKSVSLPDGSTVSLRKGSTLHYPAEFGNSERVVILNGEAFFQVQHQPTKPFRIQTVRSVVQVLGTSFLVNTAGNSDRVVVSTGKVLFSNKEVPGQHCLLSAKEEAVFDGKEFTQKKSQGSNYLSWQTGVLKFSETPIDQVAGDLSEFYNLSIKLDDSLALKAGIYTVTGEFNGSKQSLEQILGEIALFTRIRYQKQHDTIILFRPN